MSKKKFEELLKEYELENLFNYKMIYIHAPGNTFLVGKIVRNYFL